MNGSGERLQAHPLESRRQRGVYLAPDARALPTAWQESALGGAQQMPVSSLPSHSKPLLLFILKHVILTQCYHIKDEQAPSYYSKTLTSWD